MQQGHPVPPTPPQRSPSRNRMLVILGGLGCLALIGVFVVTVAVIVGVVIWRTQQISPQPPVIGPSSLSFSDLMTQTNEKHGPLTSDLVDYIKADQDLKNIVNNDSSTSDQMVSAANNYIEAAEDFLDILDSYDQYISEYTSRLSSGSSSNAKFDQGAGSPDPLLAAQLGNAIKTLNAKFYQGAGSADPLLAVQLGNAIKSCKDLVAECEAKTDEIDRQECLKALTTKCPSDVVRIGASGLFGAGASAVTGLALGSAALTLSGIGIVVGVGIAAGMFFDYCTRPSTSSTHMIVEQSAFEGVCAVSSKQVPLNSSGFGVTTLPQGGPGTLRIHIPGCAPVVLSNVTVGPSGLNVNVKCVPDDESTSVEEAAQANNDSSVEQEAEDPGTGTCSTVASIIVSPSPLDPAPEQSVTVTATVFPVAAGCSVNYTVSGTDGYYDSGSPATDSSGTISFNIPGGAEGVVDTVTVTASDSGVGSTIVYSF